MLSTCPTRSPAVPRDAYGVSSLVVLLGVLTLLRAATVVHLGLDPYVDEAYYWGWAQALDWGYYSKPPLLPVLIAASQAAFGDGLLALKLPALLLYPVTALVLRQLGAELFDSRVGWWAALAFITLPLVSGLGLFVSTDAPLLLLWALAMLLAWRLREGGGWPQWAILGGVIGLGLMAKYTMAAFWGCGVLWLLSMEGGLDRLRRSGPWLALGVALAVLAPNLWWNAQHGFPTLVHTAEITRMSARGWAPDELWEFLLAQLAALGPVLAVSVLMVLFSVRRHLADPRHAFLLCFSLPLLILVALQALTGRANGNWAAPAVLGLSVLAVAVLLGLQRRRVLVWAVGCNVAIATLLYSWPILVQSLGVELHAGNDPYKRARGWSALAEAVAPKLTAYPGLTLLSDDREVLAQLVYALRPERHARWQADGHVVDHYGLTVPYGGHISGAVLYLSQRHDPERVLDRFAQVTDLGEISVAVHRNFHRRLHAWRLDGFLGYPADGE